MRRARNGSDAAGPGTSPSPPRPAAIAALRPAILLALAVHITRRAGDA